MVCRIFRKPPEQDEQAHSLPLRTCHIFFHCRTVICIPPGTLIKVLPGEIPLLENWAFIALLVVLVFYFRLSLTMGIKVLVFAGLCIVGNYLIDTVASLWLVSFLIFAVAWVGQFYGHKLEGKKPSFFKDLQFLLIGPAWVIENLFKEA